MNRTMKKLGRYFIAALAIVASAACQKEFETVQPVEEKAPSVFVIQASVDVQESRAFLDETGDIFWNQGDALKVFQGTNGFKFTTEEEGLSCKFSYEGDLNKADGDFYALYPYTDAATIANGVITTVLPSEQTAAAGSFGKQANLAVAFAPFGESLTFKNAAAFVKVSFKTTDENAQIKKITIRSVDENVLLSGNVTLTPTVTDGVVTDVALAVTDGVPYVSVVAEEGALSPETDYYLIAAPAALAGGYRVEFTTTDGLTFTKDYTGNSYNSAAFKRNTIAPVGRKNLDKFEMDGYWRVHYADSNNHPGTGEYLVVYKMDDGSYRILNESRSDTYIVKGTHFELSGSGMAFNTSYKRQQMEGMVSYVFRNAWVSSSVSGDGVKFADEELILAQNSAITVAKYKTSSNTYYYANITLYNHTDNTDNTLTVDQLSCNLDSASDEGTVSGKFNMRSSSVNPNGNPNTCADLVDALLKHASFSGYDSLVRSAAISALEGDDNAFTGGFTTATHTTQNGIVYKDHFMIKTKDLLSGAQISNIRLYKWGTRTYADYTNNK